METKTNFFSGLAALCNHCELKLIIQCTNNAVTATVFPVAVGVEDAAAKRLRELNFCGTAIQLDEHFFAALQKPIAATDELIISLAEYERGLRQARQQSAMQQDAAQKTSKESAKQKEKLEGLFKKVDELATQKKYGEAIGVLQKASDLTEHAEAIKAKIDEMRSLHGQLQLL